MTASRWAATTAWRMALVVELFLLGGVGLVVRSGQGVVRLVGESRAQLVDELEVVGELVGQRRRGGASAAATAAWRATTSSRSTPGAGHDPEPPDDPRQRQALADERRDDDAHREVRDEVALREVERQGQRRRQRDGAAHARPRHDEDGAGQRRDLAFPDAGAQEARDVRPGEDPDDPRDDHDQADRRSVEQEFGRRPGRTAPGAPSAAADR